MPLKKRASSVPTFKLAFYSYTIKENTRCLTTNSTLNDLNCVTQSETNGISLLSRNAQLTLKEQMKKRMKKKTKKKERKKERNTFPITPDIIVVFWSIIISFIFPSNVIFKTILFEQLKHQNWRKSLLESKPTTTDRPAVR